MKKKASLILCGLALLLVLMTRLGGASAYFTSNAWAKGGRTLTMGSVNEIREEFSAWTKHVTVKAEDDSEPVFVRARAFADESVDLLILSEDGSWTDGGDGWWYCGTVLSAGESTAELLVKVVKLPVGAVAGTDFNVIVVYECSRALFKADGTPYADWTAQSEKGGAQ